MVDHIHLLLFFLLMYVIHPMLLGPHELVGINLYKDNIYFYINEFN